MYKIINDEIKNKDRIITTIEDDGTIRQFGFPLDFSNEEILSRMKEIIKVYESEKIKESNLQVSNPLVNTEL